MQQQIEQDAAADRVLDMYSNSGQGEPGGDAASRSHEQRPRIDPEPDMLARLERVLKAANPLLEAALPLLRILSDMPRELPGGEGVLAEFREALDREVRTFQAICDKASLRREHVLSARYCLCTAIDEAASSTRWGAGGVWASSSLAQRFHQDVRGGEKFFLLIGRLQGSPAEHAPLLEVMYRILGLGFEGVYGQSADSRRQLESVRHNLLGMLNSVREPVPPALSPHWKGESAGKFKLMRNFPVWVSASILGLLLFGVFAWEKYGLLSKSNQLEAEMEQIGKLRPPVLETPRAGNMRLADLLKAEVAAGRVDVADEEKYSRVTLRGDALFAMAKADVTAALQPVLERLAEEIAKVPGEVRIIGHSDSQAIRLPEFPNNQVLSEKRAASVAAVLAGKGVDQTRIKVVGRGEAEPVAVNATPAGRALNRRVELWIGDAEAIDAALLKKPVVVSIGLPERKPGQPSGIDKLVNRHAHPNSTAPAAPPAESVSQPAGKSPPATAAGE